MCASKSPPNNSQVVAGRLIYAAPQQMVGLIKMIKRLSISTTFISAGVQPFLYPKIIATGSTFALAFSTITCAGIFVSPLVLNWFTKRYVTQLFYDEQKDQFTAQRMNLFNRLVNVSYKPDEVHIPEMMGIFTTYTVGARKQPLFVDPNLVSDVDAYKHMLGFDKPINLRRQQLLEEINKLKQQNSN